MTFTKGYLTKPCTMKIIINWLFLTLVLTINALANILPINGMNTGEISGLYPNLFVPAGFTFSIWGIIYLLLLTYTISFTYYLLHPDKNQKVVSYLNSINPFFLLSCLFNASWIIAWHYLQPFLSILIMVLLLITLLVLFVKSQPYLPSFSSYDRLFLHAPFVVYLGWICVATIANITAGLVKWEWDGFGLSGVVWSGIMMGIAILLAAYITFRYRVYSFSLVVAWALWGIHEAQAEKAAILKWVPLTGIALLLIQLVYLLFSNKAKKDQPYS